MDRIVKGDTLKPVGFLLKTDGVVANLTGKTFDVHYKIGDGAIKRIALVNSAPLTGILTLPAGASNWDADGIATARVYETTGGKLSPCWEVSWLVEKDNHL